MLFVVPDVVGVYSDKKADFEAWGPHDPAPEGITEEVCIFFWLTEVCHRTPRRHFPETLRILALSVPSERYLNGREMKKPLDTAKFFLSSVTP